MSSCESVVSKLNHGWFISETSVELDIGKEPFLLVLASPAILVTYFTFLKFLFLSARLLNLSIGSS